MAPIPSTKLAADSEAASPEAVRMGSRNTRSKKFTLAAVLTLLTLGMVHGPLLRCYHRLSEHVCHKHKSVEQRARYILSHHPLIGNSCATAVVTETAILTILNQTAMLTSPC
jgi:hypothetical protein